MDKKLWNKIFRENSIVKEDKPYSTIASEIDGKDKQSAIRYIYKKINPFTQGFFRDTGWSNVQNIWNKLHDMNLDVVHKSNEYIKTNGVPTSKIWWFEIVFSGKDGKPKKIYGNLTAAGAGSVADPLDKYDITVVLS